MWAVAHQLNWHSVVPRNDIAPRACSRVPSSSPSKNTPSTLRRKPSPPPLEPTRAEKRLLLIGILTSNATAAGSSVPQPIDGVTKRVTRVPSSDLSTENAAPPEWRPANAAKLGSDGGWPPKQFESLASERLSESLS